MKKLLFVFCAFSIVSCSKNSEEIEIVKSDLLKRNKTQNDIDQMQFETFPVTGKDVFEYNQKKFTKQYEDLKKLNLSYDILKNSLSKVDSIQKNLNSIENKKFVKVIAFKVAPDTVSKSIYFIDEDKKINSFHLIK